MTALAFKPNTTATTLGTVMPSPDAALDDRTLYQGVLQLLQQRPVLKESLAARLADEVVQTDFGRAAQDRIAPETHAHPTMYFSRFARPDAGATAFVTAADPKTRQVYVLLGVKDDGTVVPPGGHLETHQPEGGIPGKAFDQNLMETSRRELREETGLVIPANCKPTSLGAKSDYGVMSGPALHTVLEGFHYNLLLRDGILPSVTGHDDLKAAFWVKAEDVFVAPNKPSQLHGSGDTRYMLDMGEQMLPIRDHYGEQLMQAIGQAKKILDKIAPPCQESPKNTIQTVQAVIQACGNPLQTGQVRV